MNIINKYQILTFSCQDVTTRIWSNSDKNWYEGQMYTDAELEVLVADDHAYLEYSVERYDDSGDNPYWATDYVTHVIKSRGEAERFIKLLEQIRDLYPVQRILE